MRVESSTERRHPTGRARMGSTTLQTLQYPTLLTHWVCSKVAAFQTLPGEQRHPLRPREEGVDPLSRHFKIQFC
jgi:hypothetical protein